MESYFRNTHNILYIHTRLEKSLKIEIVVAELGCICVVLKWVWLVPSDVTGGMCVCRWHGTAQERFDQVRAMAQVHSTAETKADSLPATQSTSEYSPVHTDTRQADR